ncbi:MAG: alanine racemase [Acholeplasmataceae bacterium]|nr:alanine racemase [Acholeplasmataceae bacterium]
MYPKLIIDLKKYYHNLNKMIEMTRLNELSLAVVSKVFLAEQPFIDVINKTTVEYLADSHLSNLKKMKTNKKKMFLRIAQLSEVEEVVEVANISLQSELTTIKALNKAAKNNNKVHEIILMFDLGDLREGIYYEDSYLKLVEEILTFNNIKLLGIGTNLTCYGGVIPSLEILKRLEVIKSTIETKFKLKLTLISGGNSSSIFLLEKGKLPKFINNLRIGEALVLGRETAYGNKIKGFYDDVFLLKASIVEIKKKPSLPDGETGMDAFGKKVIIKDQGKQRRAILAIGKQSVDKDDLIILDKSEIIGASSDHLIIDIKDQEYQIGVVLTFKLRYGGILSLMTSPYVRKSYEK